MKEVILLMGISGSGKSTVGMALSKRLSIPFLDADDFHPKENIMKMSRGLPLTDDDRWPWLIHTGITSFLHVLLSNKLIETI
uniref:shikimate kinase n=1 Tax=Roseivirga sp. TaxID=1964215 RepID=UPI0040484D1D